ncbi:helix-turn-helix domain-containing protein [Janibacter cremeus]|uniref:winged helix-turn-helix transcriptional regulator n=1 Tax=Janibacter cremeus TaxID=1285192 RepID=UPI0023F6727D|nr:helix-turn-helix domain-containing protein [Janibacter cremeus]WEV77623.1 helix-turn-helix domain-containing protein [Janibacter cremeus]
MAGYGQFCPIAKTMEVLDERWTVLIVRELLCGSHHFNELRRGVPRMSPALLSKRLRSLAKAGIVLRRDDGNRIRYELTPGGRALGPVVMALGEWGVQWRSQLGEEDFDPTLLMWDVHRNLDLDAMPGGRVVLGFTFPDVEAAHRDWWIVVEDRGLVDLCDFDPGFPVDVRVVCDLPTLVHVWRGDLDWSSALSSGGVTLEGPTDLRRALRRWLKLSPFASVARETGSSAAGR